MSLQLRQAGQEMLDSYDMHKYHVNMSQDTKALQIQDEEGDLLIKLKNVKFSKFAPTKKEIAFALGLLDQFIVKNFLTIKAYLDKKASFLAKDKVKMNKRNFTITAPYLNKPLKDRFLDLEFFYYDDLFQWQITFDARHEPSITCNSLVKPSSLTDVREYEFDIQNSNEAVLYFTKYIEWEAEKFELEALKQSLYRQDV